MTISASASQPTLFFNLSSNPIGHKEVLASKKPLSDRSLIKKIAASTGRLRLTEANTCKDQRDVSDSRLFTRSSIWYKMPPELKLAIFEHLLTDVHALLQLRQTDKECSKSAHELIEKHGCIQFQSGQIESQRHGTKLIPKLGRIKFQSEQIEQLDELLKVFPNIRHLRTSKSSLNTQKISQLCTRFTQLRSLFIDCNTLELSRSDALMLAHHKPSLQALYLTNYGQNGFCVGDYGQGIFVVREIGDGSRNNGDELGTVLASSPYLKELMLINASSGPKTVAAILENETLETVRLSMIHPVPSESDIKALLNKSALKYLDIRYTSLSQNLINLVNDSGKLVAHLVGPRDPYHQPNFEIIGDNFLRPDQDIFTLG